LAAKRFLCEQGLQFLAANFRSGKGEIDLIFREQGLRTKEGTFGGDDWHCLVFVEVKTRATGGWTRPSAAVNRSKKQLLSKTALAYLRKLNRPKLKWRFDVVEVLMNPEDNIEEIRHLRDAFPLDARYRYG
jgi:putative endonuclease